MPRPATGQVLERRRKTGRVFALRFSAYGERRYVTLGGPEDGWDRRSAERELLNVLADVRRGTWRPSRLNTAAEPPTDQAFHEFASDWLDARRAELRPTTVAD